MISKHDGKSLKTQKVYEMWVAVVVVFGHFWSRVNALLAWLCTPGLGGPVLLAAVCEDAKVCNIHIKETGTSLFNTQPNVVD